MRDLRAVFDGSNDRKIPPPTSTASDLSNVQCQMPVTDHCMMHSESEDISSNYLTAYTNFTNNLSL